MLGAAEAIVVETEAATVVVLEITEVVLSALLTHAALTWGTAVVDETAALVVGAICGVVVGAPAGMGELGAGTVVRTGAAEVVDAHSAISALRVLSDVALPPHAETSKSPTKHIFNFTM